MFKHCQEKSRHQSQQTLEQPTRTQILLQEGRKQGCECSNLRKHKYCHDYFTNLENSGHVDNWINKAWNKLAFILLKPFLTHLKNSPVYPLPPF
mmetsp:Transcript_7953/g.17261  ORF Transcript_7953/g.17261 Transcript_7953/m.17261 type:complete len:94 (+) Transcript_7953:138-419(+)